MAVKHKWKFKSYFRREAYGWNGTAKASKRMKEAVSEIKKVAKTDSALAGEGVIALIVRLYPAVMDIDSSSGALGTAINNTIDALIPILIRADWDMNTRGKLLEELYEAIIEDGWDILGDLRDCWGEICVYPGLAHLWADRLIAGVRDTWTSEGYSYFVGSDMCLSCLVYTERYNELQELLELQSKPFWSYNKFWAKALIKQGRPQEALDYAYQMSTKSTTDYQEPEIDAFCEDILIDMGRIEEAYEQYGLRNTSYTTYLNRYRGICKKYPAIDKRKILTDLIERVGHKGKWFAAAKTAGYLNIALECALSEESDPNTLLRACRDFADKDFEFALNVGIQGIIRLLTGTFYDEVRPLDIEMAYYQVAKIAEEKGKAQDFKSLLGREIMKHQCKPNLREVIFNKLG